MHVPLSARRRLTADEEIQISTDLRELERQVEADLLEVPECKAVLDRRGTRREITASAHVDRLSDAVDTVRRLRPRPSCAIRVMGLWNKANGDRWILAMSGYRIAVGEARKMNGRGLDHEDLVNEGIIGLLDAAKRFDPSRKLRFSTYARWWVRARMLRAIDTTGTTVRLPGGLLEKLRRIEMLRAQSEKAFGKWDVDTLSREIGLSSDEVRQIMAISDQTQVVPLSGGPPSGDEESRTLEDVLSDDRFSSQDRDVEFAQTSAAVRAAILELPIRYHRVVTFYLGLDYEGEFDDRAWTLQSAADEVGTSKEMIRQYLLRVRACVTQAMTDRGDRFCVDLVDDKSLLRSMSHTAPETLTDLAKKIYGDQCRAGHVISLGLALHRLSLRGDVSRVDSAWIKKVA